MYKGWRGTMKKYDCHDRLKNMDSLFDDLFINERNHKNEVCSYHD